eukprot:11206343-Lingulodinium_polyedra.AAC.1
MPPECGGARAPPHSGGMALPPKPQGIGGRPVLGPLASVPAHQWAPASPMGAHPLVSMATHAPGEVRRRPRPGRPG